MKYQVSSRLLLLLLTLMLPAAWVVPRYWVWCFQPEGSVHWCYEHKGGPSWQNYHHAIRLRVFEYSIGSEPDPRVHFHCDRVPLWPLLLIPTAFGIFHLGRSMRRVRRRNRGLCVKCAYNLSGLTVPRCPECGTAFTPRSMLDVRSESP